MTPNENNNAFLSRSRTPAVEYVKIACRRQGRSRRGLKKKRMRLIAANGMLVMLPSAIWLYFSAAKGEFGTAFIVVQGIELAGGFTQLYLLARNFRDGLRLSGRLVVGQRFPEPVPEQSSPGYCAN